MARRYSTDGNATNTASSTLPTVTLISTAAVRPQIYDLIFGSDATPADNAVKYALQRCTTTGTVGSSLTPSPIDPGDPVAVTTSGLATFSVGPTLTANTFLLQFAYNQRATFRWVAAPMGNLILPATASNGVAFMPLVVGGSAFNTVFSIYHEE